MILLIMIGFLFWGEDFLSNEDIYFDYKNNVLKNKFGITDQKELDSFEYKITTVRLVQLYESNDLIKDTESIDISCLKEIHHYLFKDIYDWAGEYRVLDISKDGKSFHPVNFLNKAEIYLNGKIKEYLDKEYSKEVEICEDLAEILVDINHFHPFREGNGRTQREFIRQLALVKGYELWIGNDNKEYMEACINDDKETMCKALVREIKRIEGRDSSREKGKEI